MKQSFNYRDLEVWKLAIVLAEAVYRLTDEFPKPEEFGLKSQLRRAAVSVSANIAEGWGHGSQAVLAKHLHIARGSLAEVDSLAHLAARLNLFDEGQTEELRSQLDTLGRKTHAFLAKVQEKVVREEIAGFGSEPVTRHLSRVTNDPSPTTYNS